MKVARDYDFEIFLFETPEVPPKPRQNPPVQFLQKFSKVPIGARGRKRKTVNIVFIGVKPNPDNRLLTPKPVQPAEPAKRTNQILLSAPLPRNTNASDKVGRRDARLMSVQPAKRTYQRLPSTQLRSNTKPSDKVERREEARLMSTPLTTAQAAAKTTDHLLSSDESASKSNLDVDFEMNLGRLCYSDSDSK